MRIVIIGARQSGKSTFASNLAYELARRGKTATVISPRNKHIMHDADYVIEETQTTDGADFIICMDTIPDIMVDTQIADLIIPNWSIKWPYIGATDIIAGTRRNKE